MKKKKLQTFALRLFLPNGTKTKTVRASNLRNALTAATKHDALGFELTRVKKGGTR
jgi:hypothetical protein